MRATTKGHLALNHVGLAGSKVEHWEGTFAECVMELARFLGGVSMATRFDFSFARSEEEARRGVRDRTKKTIFPETFDLESLDALMNESARSEGTLDALVEGPGE